MALTQDAATKTISVALRGAYLTGRREEAQATKAHIARMINFYQANGEKDAAAVLYILQTSLFARDHSQIRDLPPPREEREVA
jgi:hypothetical protein